MHQTYYRGRFSVAPMLDWTTRHCRYFHRQFTQHTLLYTEMITAPAIIHAKYDLLAFDPAENPVALQLGGSDPTQLAHCAKLVKERGYAEINLNVGCPSDRVQNGMFGAFLMGKADLVADCMKAMLDALSIPVTVKHRIGIDDLDSYEFLCDFIEKVQPYSQDFIVHARKAWLSGLSPKENREIPPLDYERVYQLKRDFPHLNISINGGIKTIEEIKTHLQWLGAKPTKTLRYWVRLIRKFLVKIDRLSLPKQPWRRCSLTLNNNSHKAFTLTISCAIC